MHRNARCVGCCALSRPSPPTTSRGRGTCFQGISLVSARTCCVHGMGCIFSSPKKTTTTIHMMFSAVLSEGSSLRLHSTHSMWSRRGCRPGTAEHTPKLRSMWRRRTGLSGCGKDFNTLDFPRRTSAPAVPHTVCGCLGTACACLYTVSLSAPIPNALTHGIVVHALVGSGTKSYATFMCTRFVSTSTTGDAGLLVQRRTWRSATVWTGPTNPSHIPLIPSQT